MHRSQRGKKKRDLSFCRLIDAALIDQRVEVGKISMLGNYLIYLPTYAFPLSIRYLGR